MGAAVMLCLQRQATVAQFEASALTLVGSLHNSLEHDMLEADRDHIQDAVTRIAEGELINEVVIFAPDQRMYASAEPGEIGTVRDDPEIARVAATGSTITRTEKQYGEYEFCVIFPVRNRAECIPCHGKEDQYLGAIEIGLERQPLDSQLREQSLILLVIGGLSFIGVGVALSFVIRSSVLDPLSRLSASARRIADGDFSARAETARSDEVGMLASTFNEMAGRVEQHASDLESARADLERRVNERTRQVQQLAASRGKLLESLITAQEEERRRIARELHDETGQTVSTIMLELARLRDALSPEDTEAKERVTAARALAARTLRGLRQLINGLRPEVLDELGLEPAVRSYVRSRLEANGVSVKLHFSGMDERVPTEVETTAFRVIQEAVANTRHGGAKSVDIQLQAADGRFTVTIADDGTGFDVATAFEAPGSWGLRGMRERVSIIGGGFSIESETGKGTRLEFWIPLEGA